MAGAKFKEGLDYFPTSTRKENKFKIIKALHGFEGHVILETLLQDIHGDKGYYVKWTERLAKIFASENGFRLKVVLDTVRDCLVEGIFNEEHFDKYSILTSEDIQKVWINVVKERKALLYLKEYILIDISKYVKEEKSVESKADQRDNLLSISSTQNDSKSLKSIIPGINSINPPVNCQDNSIYPPDNTTSKQVEEEEQLEQQKFFKKKKIKSVAFSLVAENFCPFEKNKILIEKVEKEFNEEKIAPETHTLPLCKKNEFEFLKINLTNQNIPDPPQGPEETLKLQNEKPENRNHGQLEKSDWQMCEKTLAEKKPLIQPSELVPWHDLVADGPLQAFASRAPADRLKCEMSISGFSREEKSEKKNRSKQNSICGKEEILLAKSGNRENWNRHKGESGKMGKWECDPKKPNCSEYDGQNFIQTRDPPNVERKSFAESSKLLKMQEQD
jgi:hypothetical protein